MRGAFSRECSLPPPTAGLLAEMPLDFGQVAAVLARVARPAALTSPGWWRTHITSSVGMGYWGGEVALLHAREGALTIHNPSRGATQAMREEESVCNHTDRGTEARVLAAT
eukprot:gene14709-biopygen10908